MRDLRHTIAALKSEIDLMHEVLPPPSNIKTKDVLQLVRSLGESGRRTPSALTLPWLESDGGACRRSRCAPSRRYRR